MIKSVNFCKQCGKSLPIGSVCSCTLTDLNAIREASRQHIVDMPAAQLLDVRNQRDFEIVSPRCKIGRDPTNQVVIDNDPYISRFHAWITFDNGEFFVEDLESTNGTLLNGSPLLHRARLVNGDHLRVGHTDLGFHVDKGIS
ncbi:MAG: FHA domain-containing protein [Candidatus Melainabacteria bacterium]|nr:FHA domain-containing protein [Candidatus Melainabacteria bacterium]